VARQFGCAFVDTSEKVTGISPLDSLHLSPEGHQQMARVMEEEVRKLL
jgi:lysophospholipase L1-like esterase